MKGSRGVLALVFLAVTVPKAPAVAGLLIADDCASASVIGKLPCSDDATAEAASPPTLPSTTGKAVPGAVPGTTLVRISEPAGEEPAPLHAYSRRQAWNRDESLLLVGGTILDAHTYEVVLEALPLSSESVWSNIDARRVFGIAYDPKPNHLYRFDLDDAQSTLLHAFDDYERCTLGGGEGSMSNDDRRLLVVCRDAAESATLISLDVSSGTILATRAAEAHLNWASFTQSGRWVIVENSAEGVEERELVRFNESLEHPEVLLRDAIPHGDLGVDDEGADVFVMIDWSVYRYVRIEDGRQVTLDIAGGSDAIGYGHVSCRNIDRPGWCYVSNYGGGGIGAIRVGERQGRLAQLLGRLPGHAPGYGAYERWGHHASSLTDYRSQPKVSASPSGQRIVFTSDMDGELPASDFVIQLGTMGEVAAGDVR